MPCFCLSIPLQPQRHTQPKTRTTNPTPLSTFHPKPKPQSRSRFPPSANTSNINRGTTSREPAARSRSATQGTTPLLSPRAEQLIKQQITTPIFDSTLLPSPYSTICKTAQDQGRFLTESELATLNADDGSNEAYIKAARKISENVVDLVDKARQRVVAENPGILERGGALYPEFRGEACWRDFWHFVRVVSYGIVGGFDKFLGEKGLGIMKEIYGELEVPLEAMVVGVEGLKRGAIEIVGEERRREAVGRAFGHLVEELKAFRDE